MVRPTSKAPERVDAFRSRHWVLTTCGCPPAQDSSHHQGLSFLIGNPNLNLPLPRLHAGRGDNPNMKLKTLVEKPGGHLRFATDIYFRSSIYNIDVCPLFQLDAVWPTQMQHKTKKKQQNLPQKVSYLIPLFILGSHKSTSRICIPRHLQGKKKHHHLHPGRLVNPSDVEGVDAQICARWIRGRRQRKLVVHRPDGAQDPRCFFHSRMHVF